jgi:hypothetical protein
MLYSTLATDRGFKERVREDMLIRLLDAFVWKNQDNAEEGRMAFGYVQGMNVLAAPFLYIMPSEIEAFYTFSKFIEQCCPLYVQPTLDGVHRGLTVSILSQSFVYMAQSFPVIGPLPRNPGLGAILTLTFKETFRRNLRLSIRPHILCLHATSRRSLATLGLSAGIWYPSQCPLRHWSTFPHA